MPWKIEESKHLHPEETVLTDEELHSVYILLKASSNDVHVSALAKLEPLARVAKYDMDNGASRWENEGGAAPSINES